MQQPPNPYSQYPQQQWQQPPLQPQQYQPLKQKSRKRLWLFMAAIVLVLAVMIGVASQGQSQKPTPAVQSTQPTHTTQQLTTQPTRAPQPVTAPTQSVAKAGPAILGADIAAFITKYGQPNTHSQPSNGDYNFALYGNPQISDLSVTTESNKALSILKDSSTDQGWNASEAIAACLVFTPQDTIYKRSMILLDGQGNPLAIQRVYFSLSLAKQFPASNFTDENSNQTIPGTFGIVLGYNLGSTTSFLTCSAQVGLQQK